MSQCSYFQKNYYFLFISYYYVLNTIWIYDACNTNFEDLYVIEKVRSCIRKIHRININFLITFYKVKLCSLCIFSIQKKFETSEVHYISNGAKYVRDWSRTFILTGQHSSN